MAHNSDTLQRTYDNYCRIWQMCTELIAAPTQANIDRLVSTAESVGVVRPKITYSLDGETFNWTEYQQQLYEIMAGVRRQMVFADGPFERRSIGF